MIFNSLRVLSKCRGAGSTNSPTIRSKSTARHPTTGIIVIGDEILKGQVRDTNSFYACSLLHKHGAKVEKISTVRDNVKEIAEEVKEFRRRFDYVFTCGGVGPTHDDVTYEGDGGTMAYLAAALAFDDTLHYHPTLVDIIKNRFECTDFPSPAYKMARVPSRSALRFGREQTTGQRLTYPCIAMENVHIFPGSPTFFEISFRALCKELFAGCESFASSEIFLNAREDSFASALTAVARECRNVSFGSYPERNRYYKARVTIESEAEKDRRTAEKMFRERIPASIVVPYDRSPHTDCLRKYEARIEGRQERPAYQRAIKKFVDYYRRPEEVCLYLDGSEESIVMTHLARVALQKLGQQRERKLQAFHLRADLSWPNAGKFFREFCDRYGVEVRGANGADTAETVKRLIASRPETRVLLVGKRSNGNARETYESLARLNDDGSMIDARVDFPLEDWTDEDVESFCASLSLPYFLQET